MNHVAHQTETDHKLEEVFRRLDSGNVQPHQPLSIPQYHHTVLFFDILNTPLPHCLRAYSNYSPLKPLNW